MAQPITTWPGAPGGPQKVPLDVSQAMFGRTSMFSGDQGPMYTGPFNVDMGQFGSIFQIMLPQIMQMLMGGEHAPFQYQPMQNILDQMDANKFVAGNREAMQIASRRDTGTIESMLGGVTQMMTGKPLTDIQEARNYRIAGGVSQFMPLLTQILGPDLIDQLHGTRGSATVMAQQLHHALRTSLDPITGLPGYSGQSAGRVTQDTFENLFGKGADIGMMRGMSAGQAGILMNELQARGLMGKPLGALPIDERRAALPKTMAEDQINRLAEQIPEIKKIMDEGGTPTDAMLDKARGTIRTTHKQLTDPTVKLTDKDIEAMPGAQEIIRSGDATRIGNRLKNLSGAVKAMRDIFGDMGNPNAPMLEILNGLEALTQGGLATMSASQMEMMVLKTHKITNQTGVSLQGMLGMAAQNAGLADQLGLDRSFAVTAAQHGATFGAAAGDNLRLDIPAWGAPDKERLTLADQQLMLHGAASPLANQLNAVLRMSDTGMANPAKNSELASVIDAIKRGQSTYEFDGRKNGVVMPHASMVNLLKRDAGVGETEAYSLMMDTFGNQEYGRKYDTPNMVRKIQTDETVRRMLTPVLGNRIRGAVQDQGINQLLQAQGITQSDTEFREMMDRVGEGVGLDFVKLDPAVVRSTSAKREAMGQSFKNRFRQAVKAKMPNATDAEVDAVVDNMVTQMGGDEALGKMGTTIVSSINAAARSHPLFKSDISMHNLLHRETQEQGNIRERQTEKEAIMSSALSGLGTSDPVRRLSDVLQNASPETGLHEMLSTVLGGVSVDAIRAADPDGGLAEVFGLIQENKKLDAADPVQLNQVRRNSDIVKGIIEGGDVAKEEIRKMEAMRKQITPDEATQEQKDKAIQELEAVDMRKRGLRDAGFKNAQTRMDEASKRLNALDAGTIPDKDIATERRLAAGSVRGMAAELGDNEIDLGNNRFLTKRGIITKGDDGKTKSTSKFDDLGTAREAIGALQGRQHATEQAAKDADAAAAGMPIDERLKAASDAGFIRGDFSYGNEALRQQLERAAKRDSDTSLLGDLGYQLGAKVSKEQVQATSDSGYLADKLLKEGKITDESKSAISTFVLGSRERGRQLLGDERSMAIIGAGGLSLVQGAMAHSDKLQEMATEETKRLGRTVTVGELIQGGDGITDDVKAKANEHYQGLSKWDEITKRRNYGMLPGKGDDPENKKRAAMTDLEKADLADQQQFMKKFSTAEARAADVLDRMTALAATPEQRARLGVDTNRAELLKAITEGDRGVSLNKAIHSRKELLEMAIKKGVFGAKTNIKELTDEETASASNRLGASPLSDTERLDFERLQQEAAPLMDFGLKGMRAGDITQDALNRIRQTSAQMEVTANTQDQTIKVTVDGTVTQRSDGLVDLSLEGRGVMDQVTNTLGMA